MRSTDPAFRSQRGFSLVQVMLAIGVSSLLSLALAQIFSMITAVQRRAHFDGAIVQAMEDVRMGLQRTGACLETLALAGHPLDRPLALPVDLTVIVDENKTPLLSVGPLDGGALNVRKLSLELNPATTAWTSGALLALDLVADFDTSAGFLLGANHWRRRLPITLETGAKGEVAACNSLTINERQHLEEVLCLALEGRLVGRICDLKTSRSITRAACTSIGLKSTAGEHCD